jgi:hypothetical protein
MYIEVYILLRVHRHVASSGAARIAEAVKTAELLDFASSAMM